MKSKNQISIITLGCSKNLVDSEVLMHQLQSGGYSVNHNPDHVNGGTVIINTCGFINDAKEESVDTILDFAGARKSGKIDRLFVMGCLSQRYKSQLEEEIHEVDQFFGVSDLSQILATFKTDYRKDLVGERSVTTAGHFAYLKISEGCDRKCSFCAIPLIRGKHISKTIEEIKNEAAFLAAKGVKELILIAQDLTYYGLDIYKKRALAELLRSLTDVDGIEWIRLHYAYPSAFPEEVLDVIESSPKICNYLDIPLQHISDRILKSMKRSHTAAQTVDLIRKIRAEIPEIALRTTMIVGYPGETTEDFEALKSFIREFKFERLGVFTYSHEEDTAAFKLIDDVSDELKQQRAAELMELQEGISLSLNEERIGKIFKTIIDRKEGEYWVGRSEFDSPEVDNEILIPAEFKLKVGEFFNIRISGAEAFDLYGVPA
ncbi:MAG: 30S ribosomal protein S12 methylthiotransferase RimO [Bacteroidales bacterium]|nr:30S ribosomal protein S12 methylthiotransferase RimO [Bacteroidales bacterium]